MCWHDRIAYEQIHQIAYDFGISVFIETGTFKGVNAKFQSKNFKTVISCEINKTYFEAAKERTKNCQNVHLLNDSSVQFLAMFTALYNAAEREDIVFIYLDAHFYDPNLPKEKRWVVIEELKALQGFHNCIICIHDFHCNGLGGLTYDNIPLDFDLIKDYIYKVNENFWLYCNTKESCEIHTEQSIIGVPVLEADEETVDNIRFSHTTEARKYRGMLYCVPSSLDLSRYQLRSFRE